MKDAKIQESIDKKMTAIIALLVTILENTEGDRKRKVEFVLSDVGFSPSEIAKMIGKKPDTVIKTIKRSK